MSHTDTKPSPPSITGRLHLRPHLYKFLLGVENIAPGELLELTNTSVIRRYIGERLITKTQLGGLTNAPKRKKMGACTAVLRFVPTPAQLKNFRIFLTESAELDINNFLTLLMTDMMQVEVKRRALQGDKPTTVYREFVDTYDIADEYEWENLRRVAHRRRKSPRVKQPKGTQINHSPVTGQMLMLLDEPLLPHSNLKKKK